MVANLQAVLNGDWEFEFFVVNKKKFFLRLEPKKILPWLRMKKRMELRHLQEELRRMMRLIERAAQADLGSLVLSQARYLITWDKELGSHYRRGGTCLFDQRVLQASVDRALKIGIFVGKILNN